MSNILGSLFVELKANTAAFVDGMSAASYAAKQAGRDIEDSFSRLGSIATEALAPFGPLGAQIGSAIQLAGEYAGGAASQMGKFSSEIGITGVAAAGIAGVLGALDVAAIGVTLHVAETAAKMYELSQATGVSVEALTGLGFVAKQSGVDQETLSNGLEKMNKAVFAAATAPAAAVNAFTRLGVSVRDAGGAIVPTEDIFAALAEKFQAMPDGVTKTALAIQIFGRNGAALIPVLNEGRDGINEFLEQAKQMGIVLDTDTAKSAHEFEQSLNTLEAQAEGLALSMTRTLLPTLLQVTTALGNSSKSSSSGAFTDFAEGMGSITKAAVAVGATIFQVLNQLGKFIGDLAVYVFESGSLIYNTLSSAVRLDWKGVAAEAKDGTARMAAVTQQFIAESEASWKQYGEFVSNVWTPAPAAASTAKPTGGADASAKDKVDSRVAAIDKAIAALQAQASAELSLAAATSQSTAAQRLAAASGQADQIVTSLMAEADRATGEEKIKILALINSEIGAIHALTAEKQAAKDAVSTNNELRKESDKYTAEIAALGTLVDAYARGSAAIASAEIDKQLDADRIKVADLVEEYQRLQLAPGVTAEALASMRAAVDQADASLEKHREQLEQIQRLQIEEAVAKSTEALKESMPYVQALTRAYLEGDDAIRAAEVSLQLFNWQQANPGATVSQIAAMAAEYKTLSDQQYQQSITQQAAQYDLGVQYDDQIKKLERIRDVLQDYGRSTLTVNAAIYDANQKVIEQWDAAALKVGSLKDKFTTVFDGIAIAGQQVGAKITQAMSVAVDDLSTQLSKLLVTGKGDFLSLFQSFAESLAKAQIQGLFSKVAGSLGSKLGIPGLGPARDGSTPGGSLYTTIVDSSGNQISDLLGGALTSGLSGIEKATADGFSGVGTNLASGLKDVDSVLSNELANVGSVLGGGGKSTTGFLSTLLSFIPGLAGGGPADVGQTYLVGENGPEFFTPSVPGTVSNNVSTGGASIIYQIDARGAEPGSEARIMAALKQTEDRAVVRAASFQKQLSLRTASR